MMIALLVFAAALVAALIAAPFLLPWPQHVRWLAAVASTPMDPWGIGGAVTSSGQWDVVRVASVSPGASPAVKIAFADCPRAAWLRCPEAAPVDLERLRQWAACRTPLLMVTTPPAGVGLYGPTCAVAGLERGDVQDGDTAAPTLGELTPEDREVARHPFRLPWAEDSETVVPVPKWPSRSGGHHNLKAGLATAVACGLLAPFLTQSAVLALGMSAVAAGAAAAALAWVRRSEHAPVPTPAGARAKAQAQEASAVKQKAPAPGP
jgi:hypothetical protein